MRPFPQIVDVGAKFGYYAVGLARRYPAAAVVAYDVDWWARRACRRMAAANGVGNVDGVGGVPAGLVRHPSGPRGVDRLRL